MLFDTADDPRNPVLNHIASDSAYLLYEGKWFPSNGLYKDKASMRLTVHAPAGWTVVADLPAVGQWILRARHRRIGELWLLGSIRP